MFVYKLHSIIRRIKLKQSSHISQSVALYSNLKVNQKFSINLIQAIPYPVQLCIKLIDVLSNVASSAATLKSIHIRIKDIYMRRTVLKILYIPLFRTDKIAIFTFKGRLHTHRFFLFSNKFV